jgi:hypothetical protein
VILPSWQDTFLALHAARTVEELWALLITPHGIKSSTAWDEAFILFRRFHVDDADGAVITALLLCTDHRWRKAAHHLIHRLADSDLLSADDLDGLAAEFVRREVTLTTVSHGAVRRTVWPPLRRWAAARLVTNDPSAWQALLHTARAEPSRDGAALAAGVMDVAAVIPVEERMRAIEDGLNWGSGIVRLAALPGLASLVGEHAALQRAQDDRNDKVRRWSPSSAHPAHEPAEGRPGPAAASKAEHGSNQPTLFGPA